MKGMHGARHIVALFLAMILSWGMTAVAAAVPEAATNSPVIRIGLMTKQYGILAGCNGSYLIVNPDDGKVLGEYAAGVKARIGLREGKFVVNNNVVNGDRLRLEPQKPKNMEREDRLIEINNRRYRGSVEIFPTQGATGMTAVNIVSVDDYTYGVLSRTLTPEWPEQAVKAQAIAVRTYALYNVGKHKDEGFDLCDTGDCQVYEGQVQEDAKIARAVEETRGLVVLYQNYLAAAHSHLSSGGYTENSEMVLAKAYPYLRGTADFDQTSPYYRWQKRISPQELEGLLKGAGFNFGALTAIELSRRTTAPVNAPDRGVSGRVRMITFIGKDGIAALTGEQIQKLLSLPSTLFDVSVAVPMTNIDSNITDSYGDRDTKQIQISLPPAATGGLLTDRPGIHRLTGQKNETIYLDGMGWGHGIGFSQWGAKTMAEKAINPGTDYYVTILKHYYQGVKVDKWY